MEDKNAKNGGLWDKNVKKSGRIWRIVGYRCKNLVENGGLQDIIVKEKSGRILRNVRNKFKNLVDEIVKKNKIEYKRIIGYRCKNLVENGGL